MRNWAEELKKRADFVKKILLDAHADGIVYGNSGGKDCSLVSIICKKATDNVLGVIMPCASQRNYGADYDDAQTVAKQYGIDTVVVDLTATKLTLLEQVGRVQTVKDIASANISPRLRMTTLYTIAQSRNCLVAGTGNASEAYMGYFTKWGDGAYDFNPIADLTVTEVYDFLRFLGAPQCVITKAPSAGLFEGQTDEKEMGVTYSQIDEFIATGKTQQDAQQIIERYHARTEHKRRPTLNYKG